MPTRKTKVTLFILGGLLVLTTMSMIKLFGVIVNTIVLALLGV